METTGTARGEALHGALWVTLVAGTVAVAGALVTQRFSFAVGAVLAAALAYGTLSLASRKGREALTAGEMARAGAIAGGLLVVRLVGLALLMVVSVPMPGVLDMWGVLAGMVAADATLLVTEGAKGLKTA